MVDKAFVRTVCEIKHYNVLSSWIFVDEYGDKHPLEWMNQALITLQEATEAYMFEVLSESHC
jgi:hypothetical protein